MKPGPQVAMNAERITFNAGTLSFPVGRLDADEMRALGAYIQSIYEAGVRDAANPELVSLNRSLLVLNDIEATVADLEHRIDGSR